MRNSEQRLRRIGDIREASRVVSSVTTEAGAIDVHEFQRLEASDQVRVMEFLGVDVNRLVMAAYDAAITEESTDAIIEWMRDRIRLPWFARWVPVWRMLDAFVPERLRELVLLVLYEFGNRTRAAE